MPKPKSKSLRDATEELKKPFSKSAELASKLQKQVDINSQMEADRSGEMVIGEDGGENQKTQSTGMIESEIER